MLRESDSLGGTELEWQRWARGDPRDGGESRLDRVDGTDGGGEEPTDGGGG